MRSIAALCVVGTAAVAVPQEGRPKGPEQVPPRFGSNTRAMSTRRQRRRKPCSR